MIENCVLTKIFEHKGAHNKGLEKLRNEDFKHYVIRVTGMWHASDNKNVFRILVGKSVGKKLFA